MLKLDRYRLLALLSALALSACGNGPVPWQKPGASDADIRATFNDCTEQSRADSRDVLDDQINDLNAPPLQISSVPNDTTMQNVDRQDLAKEEKEIRRDSLNRCMALAGYRPLPQQ